MSKIYYNQKVFSADAPILSGINSAFLYGQSVFSSSIVHNGKVLFFDEHLCRTLDGVMEIFDMSEHKREQLEEEIKRGVTKLLESASENDYFRLTLFLESDNINFTLLMGGQGRPSEMIKAKSVIKLPRGEYIPEQVKVGNYVNELYLKKSVAQENYNDVLYVYRDRLLEFSTGNIFFIQENKLITPRRQGIFSGIVRNKIIDNASVFGFEIEQRDIDIREVPKFDYCFLTNSVKLLQQVIVIDDKEFESKESFIDEFKAKLKSL